MLEVREIWGTPEYVAFVLQLICLSLVGIFLIISFRFFFCIQPKYIKQEKKKKLEEQREALEVQLEKDKKSKKKEDYSKVEKKIMKSQKRWSSKK